MTINPTYEELQAQVEALREHAANAAGTLGFLSHNLRGRMGEAALMDVAEKADALNEALKATPQQHLRELRAEYGRDGYANGYENGYQAGRVGASNRGRGEASEYADSIRNANDGE